MSRWLTDRSSGRRRGRTIRAPELLEGRALLATFTWASPTSGDFAVAANWDGPGGTKGVPGSGDDAVTPAGDYTITSATSETVDSFNGGAKLDVTGGTFGLVNGAVGSGTATTSTLAGLTVAIGATFIADIATAGSGGASSTATTDIDGGTIAGTLDSDGFDPFSYPLATTGLTDLSGVTLEGGAQLGGAFEALSDVAVDGMVDSPEAFTVASGAGVGLMGPGPLVIPTGLALDWSSGTMAIKSIVADGSLQVNGSGSHTLDGVAVTVAGTLDLSGAGLDLLDGYSIDIQAAASVLVFSGIDVTGGSGGTFDNAGKITDFAGTSTIAVGFSNTGSILVESALTLPGFTNASQVELDPGGSLAVAGDYTQTASGVLDVTIGAPPTANGGAMLAVSGVATFAGKLDVADGPADMNNNDEPIFVPTSGQVFPLASFASSTGQFAEIDLPSRGGLPEFALVPSATGDSLVAQPLPPTGLGLTYGDQTATSGSTTQGLPEFTGQADPGSLVQIYDSTGRLIASGTAFSYGTANPGSYVANPEATLAPGTYSLRAIEIEGGQYGQPGSTFNLTVQVPPEAPTGLSILQADDTSGPGVTTVAQPGLTGQAPANLLVQVYDITGDNLLASGNADSAGNFVARPTYALPDGTYTLEAVAINATGGYGVIGAPFQLTITPAAAPTGLALLAADATGGPGITAIHAPRLTGQATPGILVQVYDQDGTPHPDLVASAVADSAGDFVAPIESALAPGSYTLEAIAVTANGLYGALGSPFRLTISPPPPAPTGLTLVPASDTGGPGKTSIATPQLSGQSVAGLQIQVYDSGTLVAWAEVAPDGTFVTNPSKRLAVGVHNLEAIAIDAGGNYGAAGTPFVLTIT